jgi:tRNA A37 methylthiotransferase MiaB
MLWKQEKILIYWKKDEYFYGRTRNFKEVFFESNNNLKTWDIVNVKLVELDRYVIKGEIV